MTGSAGSAGDADRVTPLLRGDPPRVGEITLSGRLEVTDAGIVYAGVLADEPVVVAMLSQGADRDSYARARFHDAVRETRLAPTETAIVAGEDEPEIAPWVAVRAESWESGAKLAGTFLAPVTLDHLAHVGEHRGPDYRPHWWSHGGPGRWRVWPLPWPSALSMAGRWTYLASFAVVLAISAVALFIAVKIFEGEPPAPVNPPYPIPSVPNPTQRQPTPTPTPPTTTSPTPRQGNGTGGNPSIAELHARP